MKLTTGILILGMATGSAWAQNPDIIENTRNTMNAVVQKKAIDSNAALAASQSPASTPSAAPAKAAAPAASKPAVAAAKPAVQPKKASVVKVAAATNPQATKPAAAKKASAKKPAEPKEQVAVENSKVPPAEKKEETKQIALTGRRDPFISPVVNRSMVGSGCSSGKKCLAVDQIALKGIIRAQSGMIAVVVNAMNKAYFLRENDPVFNGYVVRITGDSIIFKETMQDRLGKNFVREVTKKITTPAV